MQKTHDTLFDGLLICKQHKDGYRFSVDAVLLANFCQPLARKDHVLDLCCGSGIVGMVLAHRNPEITIDGLEIQQQLVRLAQENITKNQMDTRFNILQGDASLYKQTLGVEAYDLVVCNPPYRKEGSGRLNISDEAMIARHEITAKLYDFVGAAAFAVRNRGRVCFVYPASRASYLIHMMESRGLAVKTLHPVYSYPGDKEAKLVLVEAVKNGGEQCTILPPLYIYMEKNGNYTPRVVEMYRS